MRGPEPCPSLYAAIRRAVMLAGHELRIVAEGRRIHTQLALIASGLGVGMMTRDTAQALSFRGVRPVPFSQGAEDLFMELALAYAGDQPPVPMAA